MDVAGKHMRVGMGVTGWSRGASSGQIDGIGHYTQELFEQLAVMQEIYQLVPVVFGQSDDWSPNGNMVEHQPRYSTSALWSACSRRGFPGGSSLSQKVDLFHASDHYTPRYNDIPVVATLMDAIPLSHPQWVSQRARKIKNWLWRQSGRWADHVITVSNYSKVEIQRHFGIKEEKISVTPLGVDERYLDRIGLEVVSQLRARLKLPERFFLFLGTFQPRKNIERILDAHEALPFALRKDVPLLIVGRNGWGSEELVARLEAYGASGHIRWLKNVDDVAKRVLLQQATALVFPSLVEGFGLPVLEGFASQTPVITSNVTSLPEVAGNAAWLIDPYNVPALTEAMVTLAREEGICRALSSKGLLRAMEFTWEACARNTVEVYGKVLSKY